MVITNMEREFSILLKLSTRTEKSLKIMSRS